MEDVKTQDVKITEDLENQVVSLLSEKFNQALLVRKATGPYIFFEIVWEGNSKAPNAIEGLFTSQGMAMKAATNFLLHAPESNTVKRDNKTKAREQRKAEQNAPESTS